MTDQQTPIDLDVVVDNTSGLQQTADREPPIPRTGQLRFEYDTVADTYRVFAWNTLFSDDGGGMLDGRLQRGRATVVAAINDCRDAWLTEVVGRELRVATGRAFPFADQWDLSGPALHGHLDNVGLQLARAGKTPSGHRRASGGTST